MSLFLELLQISLGTRKSLTQKPSTNEWVEVFKMSQTQTITGLLLDGLELLSMEERPPLPLLLEWIGTVQVIEQQYVIHRTVAAKTLECLKESGITVAFMKGLICGARYSHPARRQCGDIDFVVSEDDFKRTLDQLEKIGEVDRDLVHEHHGMVYVDGINVEPHYKVHNFQNPEVDKAMRDMFKEVFPVSLSSTRVGELSLPSFPPEFECALLVGHMINHVYAEGLGLRQVVDFMMFIQKEHDATQTERCKKYLKMMHMERSFRIFACLCETYLGMDHELLGLEYTEKEESFAARLMDDILKVGNFGRGADYFGRNKAFVPIRSYLWVLKRCFMLGYLCPAEARWWPVSKFFRYFSGKILKKR